MGSKIRKSEASRMLGGICENWRLGLTLGAPIALTALPILWKGDTGNEPYAAYVILIMGLYWMTECVPLPVTSFVPIILFPLFGILSTDRVTSAYLQDSLLFLFGGCVIALSFEYSNLHSRIALKVIMLVGPRISQLLFGIMGTTMFLSMWMNNTSTTAMMVPIVNAIMEELQKKMLDDVGEEPIGEENRRELELLRTSQSSAGLKEAQNGGPISSTSEHKRAVEQKVRNLKIMFLLGTAYASNIGGTGVITGSATNIISLDLIRKDADACYTPEACKPFLEISFLDWMLFNGPPMVLNTGLAWLYLQFHFMGLPEAWKFWKRAGARRRRNSSVRRAQTFDRRIGRAIGQKYEALGPIRFQELGVIVLFLVMVVLWLFKDPEVVPGWDALFQKTRRGKSFIKEATPTLLVAVLMFCIPSKAVYYREIFKGGLGKGLRDPILSWDFVGAKFPWGIFMLLGGGSAMALVAKESGLNKWLGTVLENSQSLQSCPDAVLLLLVLFLIAVLTTVASNTACAAILTPILLGMSYVKGTHPLYLVMAASTVCSYAFVLPVSTPPNAIVYSSAPELRLLDMAVPGLVINLIAILVLFLTTNTTSSWLLGFGAYGGQCGNMTLLSTVPR